jgi:hypothetical protein
VSYNYLDWAKYQNKHSSKSIRVMQLFFCQNDYPIREEFWQKNGFLTQVGYGVSKSQIQNFGFYQNIFVNENRDCFPKFANGLNIKIDIAQKVYELSNCSFAKILP